MPHPKGEDEGSGDELPIGGSSGKPPPDGDSPAAAIDVDLLFANGPLRRVPLFPLPNVVLFPGAILPLHVFEHRYLAMTANALGAACPAVSGAGNDGRGLVCMALIKPGQDAMADRPALHDIACLGHIVDHHKLGDGRYNLLLQGVARVRIGRESPVGDPAARPGACPYRRADLERLCEKRAFEIDLTEARAKMAELWSRPPIAGTPVAHQLEKLFASPTPTATLADVLAFDLLENHAAKQALLEELDVRRRVEALGALLDAQFPAPDSVKSLENRFDVTDS